jgi:putative hydrolase of the HAD superfamily
MKLYSTLVFDVGGTLLHLDLDRLAQAYVQACDARGLVVDAARTRAILRELESELPRRSRERQISLEEENGQKFWVGFYSEGFRRLGVQEDMTAPATEITQRFQEAGFETLYPDVVPALEALLARGVRLGILSNFSSNLEDVLRLMGVHQYFSFFVVSALVGVEKPDPRIFDLLVQAADRPANEILYVGDSLFHDVEGAERAGLAAVLVDRDGQHPDFAGLSVRSLTELVVYATKEGNANSA